MLRLWKTEMWKALHNKMFYMALMFGSILSAWNLFQTGRIARDYIYQSLDDTYVLGNGTVWGGASSYYTVYNCWIGAAEDTHGAIFFWFALPLLAAMSYGWSAQAERKNGYQNQLRIRCGRRKTLLAKYLAAMVSGALTVGIPVCLNFLITALYLPARKPVVASGDIFIMEPQFGSLLFYEKPLLFVAAVIGLVCLWGCAFGALSMAVGILFRKKILAVMIPFLLCMVAETLFSSGVVETTLEWSPRYLFHLVSIRATSGWIIFGEIAALLLISSCIVLRRGLKDEGL